MAHDVFISHSKEDKPTADAVCAALEAAGIRCWIAPRDVLPGMPWSGSIVRAIGESHIMVLLFSSNSNGSQQVLREVDCAVSEGVIVVPFRIEDVRPSDDMKFYLGTPHWLDAITPPLAAHLQRLCKTVKALVPALNEVGATGPSAGPSVVPTPPPVEPRSSPQLQPRQPAPVEPRSSPQLPPRQPASVGPTAARTPWEQMIQAIWQPPAALLSVIAIVFVICVLLVLSLTILSEKSEVTKTKKVPTKKSEAPTKSSFSEKSDSSEKSFVPTKSDFSEKSSPPTKVVRPSERARWPHREQVAREFCQGPARCPKERRLSGLP